MPNSDNQPNILISACLLGNPVRYDGTDLFIDHPLIKKWLDQDRLIAVCPEVEGGMSVPRAPAEITNGDGKSVLGGKSRVIDSEGEDVTNAFIKGALKTLKMALDNECVAAILTEHSPSCGSNRVYDGSFTKTKRDGVGVTTSMLEQNHIPVFNQEQLEDLQQYLENGEYQD
ncbi:MAG: hypothetical protein ACI88H_003197 [Cocleimonas sp.]|jgi:uncharacterized protein YbbK (DUF523 family)